MRFMQTTYKIARRAGNGFGFYLKRGSYTIKNDLYFPSREVAVKAAQAEANKDNQISK